VSVVYVIGFEQVDSNSQEIVQERNQAFTAMTRTRGWCILTGVGKPAEDLFAEVQKILADPEQITFTIPDPKSIKRNLDNLEYERRRNRIKKAHDLANQLERILSEMNDPALRKQLIDKLSGGTLENKT